MLERSLTILFTWLIHLMVAHGIPFQTKSPIDYLSLQVPYGGWLYLPRRQRQEQRTNSSQQEQKFQMDDSIPVVDKFHVLTTQQQQYEPRLVALSNNMKDYRIITILQCFPSTNRSPSLSLKASYLIPKPSKTAILDQNIEFPSMTLHKFGSAKGKVQNREEEFVVNSTLSLLETMAWMSDVIVIEVSEMDYGGGNNGNNITNNVHPAHFDFPLAWTQALRDGFQRRRQQRRHVDGESVAHNTTDLTKGSLMIVLSIDETRNSTHISQTDWEQWRSNWILQPSMSLLEQSDLEEFVICTPLEVPSIKLRDLQDFGYHRQQQHEKDKHLIDEGETTQSEDTMVVPSRLDLPVEGFPLLVNKVYESVTKQQSQTYEDAVLKPIFDHVNVEKTVSRDESLETMLQGWDYQANDENAGTDDDEEEQEAEEMDEYNWEMEQNVLDWALEELRLLRTMQEDNWLHIKTSTGEEDIDETKSNLESYVDTDFGSVASTFLDNFFVRHKQIRIPSSRKRVIKQVGMELQNLYQQNLEWLRHSYGQEYEAILDEKVIRIHNESQQQTHQKHVDSTNQILNQAIARIANDFRNAAMQSIPILARPGGVFRDMDLEYAPVLAQLLEDMSASTELWQLDHATTDAMLQIDGDDDTNGGKTKHRRQGLTKWYHKLGARLLVLGVNYAQGWLAWQGIQRAAVERERRFPKFPIF